MGNTCLHCTEHYRGCDGSWYIHCTAFDKDMPSDECGCAADTPQKYCDQFTTNPNEED